MFVSRFAAERNVAKAGPVFANCCPVLDKACSVCSDTGCRCRTLPVHSISLAAGPAFLLFSADKGNNPQQGILTQAGLYGYTHPWGTHAGCRDKIRRAGPQARNAKHVDMFHISRFSRTEKQSRRSKALAGQLCVPHTPQQTVSRKSGRVAIL